MLRTADWIRLGERVAERYLGETPPRRRPGGTAPAQPYPRSIPMARVVVGPNEELYAPLAAGTRQGAPLGPGWSGVAPEVEALPTMGRAAPAGGALPVVPVEPEVRAAAADPAGDGRVELPREYATLARGINEAGLPVPPEKRPQMFVDSDGIARVGFNMGTDSGLAPATREGVPEGLEMVPVPVLQGAAAVGLPPGDERGLTVGQRDMGPSMPTNRWNVAPDAPARYIDAPTMAPTTPEQARGGMWFNPGTNQWESAASEAQRAEANATRDIRWGPGPESAQARELATRRGAQRQESAAMRALEANTAAAVQRAQGTPVVGAGAAGAMGWDPVAGRYVTMAPAASAPQTESLEQRLFRLSQALRNATGAQIDPQTMLVLGMIKDAKQRQELLQRVTQGNPEVAKQIEARIMQVLGVDAADASPGGEGARTGQTTGGAEPRAGSRWELNPAN